MAEQGAQKDMAVQGAPEAMAVQGAPKAMAVQGALEAMAGGLCGRGLVPLGPATTAGTLLPPPKKSMGQLRGYQEPSGAILRNRGPPWAKLGSWVLTGHDGSTTALLGLDVESGALTGYAQQLLPLLRQERQVAGNGLRGHNQRSLPQTSLHGPDRKDKIH